VTLNPPDRVNVPPSGLVTVTFRALRAAFAVIVIRTRNCVELKRVTEFTVIPPPENATITPPANLVPLIVTLRTAPRGADVGLSDVIVGLPVTEKPPALVVLGAPGLVTVTFREPIVAVADTVMRTVSCVALLRVIEFTVMPEPKLTVPPPVVKFEAKLAPVITIAWFAAPCPLEVGLTDVTVAGLVITRRHPVQVPRPPSGLMTVTSRKPSDAVALTVSDTVIDVAEVRFAEFTVTPVPLTTTVAPTAKFDPVTTALKFVAPWPTWFGESELATGEPFTVNAPVAVTLAPPGLVTVRLRAPSAALLATDTISVSWFALFHVVEFTVTPVPEKAAVAPFRYPPPVTITVAFVAPRPREFGLTDEMLIGTTAGFTVCVAPLLMLGRYSESPA
jgi:hypothetical protein